MNQPDEYPITPTASVTPPPYATASSPHITAQQVLPYMRPDKTFVPFKPTQGLAKFAIVMFYIAIDAEVVSIVSTYFQINLVEQMKVPDAVSQEQADSNDMRQAGIAFVYFIVLLILVIAFLKWLYRSYRNQLAMGITDMRMSPGWAVGYWFIPILNLWKPYQGMKDLYQASDPTSTARYWQTNYTTPLLGWWWAFWLLSSFIGNASQRMTGSAKSIETLITGSWVDIFSCILSIVAAVFGLRLVRMITDRQGEKYSGGAAVQHTPFYTAANQ
jgi:hypothetical protein